MFINHDQALSKLINHCQQLLTINNHYWISVILNNQAQIVLIPYLPLSKIKNYDQQPLTIDYHQPFFQPYQPLLSPVFPWKKPCAVPRVRWPALLQVIVSAELSDMKPGKGKLPDVVRHGGTKKRWPWKVSSRYVYIYIYIFAHIYVHASLCVCMYIYIYISMYYVFMGLLVLWHRCQFWLVKRSNQHLGPVESWIFMNLSNGPRIKRFTIPDANHGAGILTYIETPYQSPSHVSVNL